MPGATAAVSGDVAGAYELSPSAHAGAASSNTTSGTEINERIRPPICFPRSCILMHSVGVETCV